MMGESCLLCGGEVRIVFSPHRARRGFYPQLTIDHDGEPHKCGFTLDRIMECVCGEVVTVRRGVKLDSEGGEHLCVAAMPEVAEAQEEPKRQSGRGSVEV